MLQNNYLRKLFFRIVNNTQVGVCSKVKKCANVQIDVYRLWHGQINGSFINNKKKKKRSYKQKEEEEQQKQQQNHMVTVVYSCHGSSGTTQFGL